MRVNVNKAATADPMRETTALPPRQTVHRGAESLPMPFGWFAVAYSSELDVGDVRPLFVFGQHVVLFRTEDGEAHLATAFCPHLGAHLGHGGRVEGNELVCPFHGWRFDGAGNCVAVPYAKSMPRRARQGPCLYSHPVREINRLIWVWHHPRRFPPTFDLDEIPEFSAAGCAKPECFEWDVNVPVQDAGENAVDIAHFATVHGVRAVRDASMTLDGHRRNSRISVVSPAIDSSGNVDMSRNVVIELLTTSCGPGMSTQVFSMGPKVVMLAAATPITAARLKMRFAFAKPADSPPQAAMLADALIAEVVRQVEQDIPIWEHKTHWAAPMLCDGDGPIAQYRRWFSQFYDESPA